MSGLLLVAPNEVYSGKKLRDKTMARKARPNMKESTVQIWYSAFRRLLSSVMSVVTVKHFLIEQSYMTCAKSTTVSHFYCLFPLCNG